MVVKDNCPIFDAWIVVSEQAIPTENQAFAALTVPLTVRYRWRTSIEITSAILKSIPLASEENCYVPLI